MFNQILIDQTIFVGLPVKAARRSNVRKAWEVAIFATDICSFSETIKHVDF